jgi:hypothetical protein
LPEVDDESFMWGKLQHAVQEGEPFFDLCSRHTKYFAKVKHGVSDCEVGEKCDVLKSRKLIS